jgi:hypothetical protein
MKGDEISLAKRAAAPTPKFFRRVRTIGLCLAAVGGAIIASPVALPAALVTAASYITLVGGVMSAVAQVSVGGE